MEGTELRSSSVGKGGDGVGGGEEVSGSGEVTLLDLGLDAVGQGDGSAGRARTRNGLRNLGNLAMCLA
jgi:hypothetical protein